MDNFGIGHAMYGMALTYFQAARGTGRTNQMIEGLQDGDRVVFDSHREAERVRRLCEKAGKDIDCVTVHIRELDRLFEQGPSRGRTIFDHTWVEKWYLQKILNAQAELQNIENDSSHRGEPPRYSDIARKEGAKWAQ